MRTRTPTHAHAHAHPHTHTHTHTHPHTHIFTPTYQHTLIHSHTQMHNAQLQSLPSTHIWAHTQAVMTIHSTYAHIQSHSQMHPDSLSCSIFQYSLTVLHSFNIECFQLDLICTTQCRICRIDVLLLWLSNVSWKFSRSLEENLELFLHAILMSR